MATEFCEEYTSTLNDLTYNSKPHITTLTMLAEENRSFAPQIVQVIEAHLNKVVPELKLPVLYLIDSIVKNIGQEYVGLFTQNIVSTFCNVFEKVDEKVRMQMFKLRQTWNEFFPAKKLYAIDVRVHQIDPAWPITARTTVQPSIHVNPKFLKTNSEGDSKRDANDVQEAEMRKQLIEKQEELLRLQQEKLELELIQTKAMMEEQKRQLMLKDQQLRYQQQLQAEAHKRLLQQKLQQQLQVLQQQQQQLQQQKLHQQVIQGQPVQMLQALQLQMLKVQQGVVLPHAFPDGEQLLQSSEVSHKDVDSIVDSLDTDSKQSESDTSGINIVVSNNNSLTPISPRVKNFPPNIVKLVSGDKEKESKFSALPNALPVVSGKPLDANTPKIEKTKSPVKKGDKSRDSDSKKKNSPEKRDKSSGRSTSSNKDKTKSKQPDAEPTSKAANRVSSPKSKKGKTAKESQASTRRSRSSSKDRAVRKSSSPSRKARGGSHESGSASPTRKTSKLPSADSPPTRKPKRQRASGAKSRSGKGDAASAAKKEVAGKENSPFGGSKESTDVNPPAKKSKTDEDDKIELFGNTDQDYRQVHADAAIHKRGSDHGGWAQYKASHPSEFKSPGVSNHPFSFGSQDMDLRQQVNQRPPPGKFRGPISFSLRRDSRDRDPRKRVRPSHVFDRMVELDKDIPKALMLDRGADILRQANQQLMDGQLTNDQHAEFMEQLGKLYELQRMRRVYREQMPDVFVDQPRNKIQLPFRKPNIDDDDDGRASGGENSTDVCIDDDDVQIIGVVGGDGTKSETPQSRDNSKAPQKHDDENSKSSRAKRVKKSRFEPVSDNVTSKSNSEPNMLKRAKSQDKDVEVVSIEPGTAPTVSRIMIDDRLREIRIVGDKAVVIMDGDVPREISFKGSPQEVIIDEKVILLPFDETLHFDLKGRSHTLRFGYPSREIVLDGVAYKAIFGGPPIKVSLDGRPCDVRLCGPPPEVCIGDVPESDPALPAPHPPPVPKEHDSDLMVRDRGHDKDIGDRFARDRDFAEGSPWERRGRFGNASREKDRVPEGPPRGSAHWDFYGEQGHRSRRFPERDFYSTHGGRRGGVPPQRGRRDFNDYEYRDGFGPRREQGFVPGPHFDDGQVVSPASGGDPRHRFEGQGPPPPRHLSWRMPQPHPPMAHFHQAPGPGPSMFGSPYGFEAGPHMAPNPMSGIQMPGEPMEMGGLVGVPPLPTKPASSINDLFEKLVAAGIIPKVSSGDQEGESSAVRDADSEDRPREVIEKMPPMDFKMETLKVRHSSVIAHLYSGIQCSSCGVRFTSEQTEKYAQHLDWHFRQNRKEKDSVKKALSRKWFYDVQGWIQFEEVEDLEERARSFFEIQANEDQPEGGGDDAPSVAADEDEKQNVCSVCGEPFELYWEEELEEWHLRDAMRAKGKNYHPICFEDLNEAVEEAKAAKQRAMAAVAKSDEKEVKPMEIGQEKNASSEAMVVDQAADGVKAETSVADDVKAQPSTADGVKDVPPNVETGKTEPSIVEGVKAELSVADGVKAEPSIVSVQNETAAVDDVKEKSADVIKVEPAVAATNNEASEMTKMDVPTPVNAIVDNLNATSIAVTAGETPLTTIVDETSTSMVKNTAADKVEAIAAVNVNDTAEVPATTIISEIPLAADTETSEVVNNAGNIATAAAGPPKTETASADKAVNEEANLSTDAVPGLDASADVSPVVDVPKSGVEPSAKDGIKSLEEDNKEGMKLPENEIAEICTAPKESSKEEQVALQCTELKAHIKVEPAGETSEYEKNRCDEVAGKSENVSVEDAMVALFGETSAEVVVKKEHTQEAEVLKADVAEPVLEQEDEILNKRIENIMKDVHGEVMDVSESIEPMEVADVDASNTTVPIESMEVDRTQEMEVESADLMAYRNPPVFETQDTFGSHQVASQDTDVQHAVSLDPLLSMSLESVYVDRVSVVSECRLPHEQDENELCESKSMIVEHDNKPKPVEHDETELISNPVNKTVLTIQEGVEVGEARVANEASEEIVIKFEPEMNLTCENAKHTVEAEAKERHEFNTDTKEKPKELEFEVLPPVMRGTELSGLCTIL